MRSKYPFVTKFPGQIDNLILNTNTNEKRTNIECSAVNNIKLKSFPHFSDTYFLSIGQIGFFILLEMSSMVAQYPGQRPQSRLSLIPKSQYSFIYATILIRGSKLRRTKDSRKNLLFSTNFRNLSIIT